MREVTEFDFEWVGSIAGREVTLQEVIEFLDDLDNYEASLEISPEVYAGD
jgi:hypothetical protein